MHSIRQDEEGKGRIEGFGTLCPPPRKKSSYFEKIVNENKFKILILYIMADIFKENVENMDLCKKTLEFFLKILFRRFDIL